MNYVKSFFYCNVLFLFLFSSFYQVCREKKMRTLLLSPQSADIAKPESDQSCLFCNVVNMKF